MKEQLMTYRYIRRIIGISVIGIVASAGAGWFAVSAFVGPSQGGGVGNGGIGVDSANNLSLGTSTPRSDTKLIIVASSSLTDFAIQVLQSTGNPIFSVRNDGKIGIGGSPGSSDVVYIGGNLTVQGTINASAVTGLFSGFVAASNIIPGVFATTSGNFAFRSSLGVNTTTQVGLPAELSVYGKGYFTTRVGIGSPPTTALIYAKSAAGAAGQINLDTTDSGSSAGTVTTVGFLEAGTTRWTIGNSSTDAFFIAAATSTPFVITQAGNVGIGINAPQSGLHVANGKYAQFEMQSAGAPVATDCDAAAERGRVSMDTTNNRLYMCVGSSTIRWSYVNLQ